MCGTSRFLCLKLLVTALSGLLHPVSSASHCVAIGGKRSYSACLIRFLIRCVFFTALELDKNKIIEAAPLSFRSLLGVLGIEAALDSLIKLLCVEND